MKDSQNELDKYYVVLDPLIVIDHRLLLCVPEELPQCISSCGFTNSHFEVITALLSMTIEA